MKIFMTGGTGFIGAWVIKEILEQRPNDSIVLLARNPDKIPGYKQEPRIKLVQGQLNDYDIISEAMQSCEACVHIALGWGDTPLTMLENDTKCTVHLLQQAALYKMKRFIYTSSSAAGGHDRPSISETSDPQPKDLYGATKLASEGYVRGVSHQLGLNAHIIRPGYTFGNPAFPGATTQVDQRFHQIVAAALENAPIELTKEDGTQFIVAKDLAKLYPGCLDLEEPCQTFYGMGTAFVTWEHIARMVIDKTSSTSVVNLKNDGRSRGRANFDVTKIKHYFGVCCNPEQHLSHHLDWLIEHLSN